MVSRPRKKQREVVDSRPGAEELLRVAYHAVEKGGGVEPSKRIVWLVVEGSPPKALRYNVGRDWNLDASVELIEANLAVSQIFVLVR